MKLPMKLRVLKAKNKYKNKYIAEFTGASIQSVKDWCHDERCPKTRLKPHFAAKLVEFSDGYITLKDCGHKGGETI